MPVTREGYHMVITTSEHIGEMTAGRSVTAQRICGGHQSMGLASLASVYFNNPTLRMHMCIYVVCTHITSLYQRSDLKVTGCKTVNMKL
jgi:hypothetical protein